MTKLEYAGADLAGRQAALTRVAVRLAVIAACLAGVGDLVIAAKDRLPRLDEDMASAIVLGAMSLVGAVWVTALCCACVAAFDYPTHRRRPFAVIVLCLALAVTQPVVLFLGAPL